MTASDARTEETLLEYITRKGAVSFDGIYDFMVAKGLQFGAAGSPIEILDDAASTRGLIDVNYDLRMIYRRTPTSTSTEAVIAGR